MGFFSKKGHTEAPLDAQHGSATVVTDAGGAAVDPTTPAAEAPNPFEAPPSTEKMHFDAQPTSPTPSAGHSISESLYTAKETAVSGAAVAFLIIWTIAVAGWTGFQVVQNALVWAKLEREPFTRRLAKRGYQGIDHMEVKALWALVAIEAALLVMFLALSISLMWVPCISACRQHKRARRTKRSFLPWFITLAFVGCAWFKLFTLSSVLNKMSYQGIWCATGDNLDIRYTFDTQGAPAPPPGCSPSPYVTEIRRAMVYAMLTVAFHLLVYFGHQPRGAFGKLFGAIPTIIVVALLVLKPLTSMMNWYYTQNYFINRVVPPPPPAPNNKAGDFTFTAELIVALISFITAVWLSLYMGWAVHALRLLPRFTNTLLSCCGKRYEDVYYEHDEDVVADPKVADVEGGPKTAHKRRKSYRLRAAGKSLIQQYYYMTQLPSVFGFVSPMITYFSLDVRNWWIVFDIIVGAALIFTYMLLCAFHRVLLAPSKN